MAEGASFIIRPGPVFQVQEDVAEPPGASPAFAVCCRQESIWGQQMSLGKRKGQVRAIPKERDNPAGNWRYGKRARHRRIRKFAPEEDQKYLAERSKRLTQRAARGRPTEPERTDLDWELDESESGRSLSWEDESNSEEEPGTEKGPDLVDVPTKVCGSPVVLIARASAEEHVHVTLLHGAQSYRGMMDIGITITIFSGVRFMLKQFVGYEPTREKRILMQNLSGQLLSFMGPIVGRPYCRSGRSVVHPAVDHRCHPGA